MSLLASYINMALAPQPLWYSLGEQLLAEARHLVDYSDAANHDGRYAVNQNDPRPTSLNYIAFPTGPMANESGGTAPAKTNYYGGLVDPSGVTFNATRLLSSGTNQAWYFYRASNGVPIPAGQVTLRFRIRSNSGLGAQSIQYGLASGYTSGTAQELDWSSLAHEAATTITITMTWTGSGDIALRLPASGTDVLIDRAQLYAGTADALPTWEEEVAGLVGARRSVNPSNSMPLASDGALDTTGINSGVLIYEPGLEVTDYSAGLTVMQVQAVDTLEPALVGTTLAPGGYAPTVAASVFKLGLESPAPYRGEATENPTGVRSNAAANVLGRGVYIHGHAIDPTSRISFLDSIPRWISDEAWAGFSTNRWHVGSWHTQQRSDLQSQQARGRYYYTVIWQRKLSIAEWQAAVTAIRLRLAGRSVSLMDMRDYVVATGDSNDQRADQTYLQLGTAAGRLAPQRDMHLTINAVGGQGLVHLERDASGVDSAIPLTDPTVTENGRWFKKDKPAVEGAVMFGRYCRYLVLTGTNDWAMINAIGTAAYAERLQAHILRARAVHERVHVGWKVLLPQNTDSAGRTNWETQRAEITALMTSWAADKPWFDLVPFGTSETIGSRPLQDSGAGGPYYLSDEIHFEAAGEAAADAILAPNHMAWRTALGIAA